jgi:hypothetical protein
MTMDHLHLGQPTTVAKGYQTVLMVDQLDLMECQLDLMDKAYLIHLDGLLMLRATLNPGPWEAMEHLCQWAQLVGQLMAMVMQLDQMACLGPQLFQPPRRLQARSLQIQTHTAPIL